MKKKIFNLLMFVFFFNTLSTAQTYTYKGRVTDANTGEALIGVNITVKDNVHGTVTRSDGTFEYTCPFAPPLNFVVSYIGYEKKSLTVNSVDEFMDIKLNEITILGAEVVVAASRVEENILEAPVSIEKLNLKQIEQSSAVNFYDGLYQLKGVDMNVHGLTFQIPNTRGFNSYSNYRLNQVVDGVENIAAGLGFAAGNIFGADQTDIESVEMVVGASTALYGPGGMNGTLIMHTKDPFRYQGLTFSAQGGIMNIGSELNVNPNPMGSFNLRFAKAFSNRMAIKITGSYLTSRDWFAGDLRDRGDLNNPDMNRISNPGYDGVNIYGDESLVSVNLQDVAPDIINGIADQLGIQPGTPEYDALYGRLITFFPDQMITRTGWVEKDLTPDYANHTENYRFGASFHYFITEKTQFIAQGVYSGGSSVYTAQNRFALNDFAVFNGKLEINNPRYNVRIWGNSPKAGPSYDIGATALWINEAWKPSQNWFTQYLQTYTFAALTGDPNLTPAQIMENAHRAARTFADNRDPVSGAVLDPSQPAFPLPGSTEFENYRDNITGKPLNEGGSGVQTKNKVMQIEGMYDFSDMLDFMKLQVGANYRIYSVNSDGTIYIDEPGNPLSVYQYGGFVQIIKNFANEHLKITGTFRYDKNENFKAQYTPRFSLIYFADKEKKHSIRATYQTAYRFPSLVDQFVDIQAGLFRSVGGLKKVHDKYSFSTTFLYPMSGRNPLKDHPVFTDGTLEIPEFDIEKVVSYELGYKGLLFKRKLFVDAYVYYNKYRGFEATQLLAQYFEKPDTTISPIPEPDAYFQTYVTTDDPVSSMGWALGLDYLMPNGILLKGNVAFNKLIEGIDKPGVEAQFNTPEYRANFTIGHNHITKHIGFNVNVHWQNSFVWEGAFGTGEIPAYLTIDAGISYKIPKIKTTVKFGGSNITNNYYTTSFGSAQIGALYYITLTYDDVLGYLDKRRN